jgi:ElaB/YqjD/DUF883 family membrane-anchored ribosome-binding protein
MESSRIRIEKPQGNSSSINSSGSPALKNNMDLSQFKSESKTESKPEIKTESKSESKPELKSAPKAEIKASVPQQQEASKQESPESSWMHDMRSHAEGIDQTLQSFVKRSPIAAVAVAVGVGFVGSLIMKNLNNSKNVDSGKVQS